MKEIAASEFKAKCLALMEQVHKTKQPIRITKFGKPLVDVIVVCPEAGTTTWIGSMKDTMKITGDIVSPANDENEWEALHD